MVIRGPKKVVEGVEDDSVARSDTWDDYLSSLIRDFRYTGVSFD